MSAAEEQTTELRVVHKHPLAIRWFHWVNFPALGMMVWSGLLIYWANRVYRIGWGSWTLFPFFPEPVFKFFRLEARLSEGMAWHFTIMWIFMINGLLYVAYTFFSGEYKLLVPGKGALGQAIQVVLHDLKIRKEPLPEAKFNAAQQISYCSIILMGAGSLLTGLAIWKPVQVAWLLWLFGGYEFARIIHFALTMGYVLFFFVHVGQVIKTGWNNFRAMITGYELVKVEKQ